MHEPTQDTANTQGNDAVASRATQAPVVHILGTQPATWLPIAHALQQLLEASGTIVVAMPDREIAGVCSAPGSAPSARIIAFVDSPARSLAQWVASGTNGTASEVLDAWRKSARHLLQLVYREPGRCLLIDTAEAAAAPDALARTVARWHPSLPDSRLALDNVTRPDALCVALARHLCSTDAAFADAFDELHAASALLSDKLNLPTAERSLPDAPIQRYRALLASEDEKERLSAQFVGLQADNAALDRALLAAEDEKKRLSARLIELRAENEALGQQLREAMDRSIDAAESAILRSEVEASRQEGELLLLQLHRVQEELERYYLQQKALEDASERFGWRGARLFAPSAIRLLGQHKQAPHLHLHFAVEDVRSGARVVPRLEVRLLDHLGRPGIAVFSTGSSEALAAWQATGDEAGRPFMTLMPSDRQGRLLLERMGTADWQLVNHLAQSIQRFLGDEGSHLGMRWQVTAARLCRQLVDMPPRLRYDRMQISRVDGEDGPQLDLIFGRASFGDRLLDQVQLRWRAFASGGKADTAPLRWLHTDDPTNVPLASWPVGDDGQFAAAFSLPVGRGSDATQKRQQWGALSTSDRALVLAVLDALPGAAERTPDSAMTVGADQGRLAREAVALHKDGRRAVAMLQVRGVLRRVLRRTGGSE